MHNKRWVGRDGVGITGFLNIQVWKLDQLPIKSQNNNNTPLNLDNSFKQNKMLNYLGEKKETFHLLLC